jgi:hypothetical protein
MAGSQVVFNIILPGFVFKGLMIKRPQPGTKDWHQQEYCSSGNRAYLSQGT